MPDEQGLIQERASMSREELQTAIVAEVRQADPACEAFVGIVIERIDRDPEVKANWVVKGVKFGRADRTKANSILAATVERMQQQFDLTGRTQPERWRVSLWEPADAS